MQLPASKGVCQSFDSTARPLSPTWITHASQATPLTYLAYVRVATGKSTSAFLCSPAQSGLIPSAISAQALDLNRRSTTQDAVCSALSPLAPCSSVHWLASGGEGLYPVVILALVILQPVGRQESHIALGKRGLFHAIRLDGVCSVTTLRWQSGHSHLRGFHQTGKTHG